MKSKHLMGVSIMESMGFCHVFSWLFNRSFEGADSAGGRTFNCMIVFRVWNTVVVILETRDVASARTAFDVAS